ncbi:hypothetical protein, partial [Paramuribaculum intestinale]|uniref:hypothetical protein n=1 Tax=Paramuribaculum intestinale TaxID=2094151 RepID=UPI0025B4FA8E
NSVFQTRKPSSSNKSLILHLPVEPATDPDVSRTPHYNTVLRRNTWQFDAFFLNLRSENQIIIII